jgi:hypothetical protein
VLRERDVVLIVMVDIRDVWDDWRWHGVECKMIASLLVVAPNNHLLGMAAKNYDRRSLIRVVCKAVVAVCFARQ